MYHVTGTLTVATLLYLISFYFYRAGFYSLQFHRKLWNILLAAAFLATASAGIFLALQVNHKWDFRITETILKWHVEFGIGMAVTGLFHLLWHLSYYTGIFWREKSSERRAEGSERRAQGKELRAQGKERRAEGSEQGAGVTGLEAPGAGLSAQAKVSASQIKTSLLVVGFVSSAIQLLFLREIMNITGGYELISGVFFGSWLITSAAGSAMAGRSALDNLRKLLLTFSLSPILSLFLMIFLSRLFMITGQTPTFLESFIYTLLVIGPFCFVSGFTFVRLLEAGRADDAGKSGYYFSIETFGGVLAGILVSVMTAGLFNTYELLSLIIVLVIAFTILSLPAQSKKSRIAVKLLTIILTILILGTDTDRKIRQLLLPGIRITSTRDTPYGNLTWGEYEGEQSIFYNQRLLKYPSDAAEREEDIHYAMLQCENPEKVLLVSGPLLSRLPELKKYPVKKITYIERDPALIESEVNDSIFSGPGVEISADDAFTFVRETKRKFDVIMLLVPPPSTLLLNRYYTTGFFSSAKEKLENCGVLMCSPGLAQNYYNRESLLVISSVYNSLKKVFRNVLPISGNRLYLIASDHELSPAITSLVTTRGIQNMYVSPDYLSDDLIALKSSEILDMIDPEAKENTLSSPVACMSFQSLIFSMKASEKIPSVLLLTLLFAAPVIAVRRRYVIMYAGACSMAGFEIILLLALQLSVGNMYALTGLVTASVMSGLAAGAFIRFPGKFSIKSKVLLLVIIYLLAALLLSHLQNVNNHIVSIAILVALSFVPGMITGNLFRELASYKENSVSGVYSADLAGSAAGFIIISAIAVPVIGITMSVILLAAINFAGFLFGTAPANE